MMLSEKKGNVMVTAGNNGTKTAYVRAALSAGLNVLADKPMAINVDNFGTLQECFDIARQQGVLLYDIMTERFEITTMLQREFSLIPGVYGRQQAGTPDEPGIVKESVHHFLKTVSGSPLIRPVWYFDVEQQGAGVVDVTTHLVDLVQWGCFPEQIIDYKKDVELIDANSWDTRITQTEFEKVTGYKSFPEFLNKDVRDDILYVAANGDITYKIKDVCAKVSVVWNYSFPEGGGDTHYSIMRGSKSHLIIEQGEKQGYKPELTIKAVSGTDPATFENELNEALKTITSKFPGVSFTKTEKDCWKVIIPDQYHNGHEAHFGQVTENFLQYLTEGALPDWEAPNMIAKYYITTHAFEIAKNKRR
jgi:predicted dehydrogenase